MKILTFKRFVGLTALGVVAYVHKQRGGVWTLASIKDTLEHLWSSAVSKLDLIQHEKGTRSRVAGSTGTAAREGSHGNQGSQTYSGSNINTHTPGRS